MWATIAGHGDDATRHDLDRVGVENAVIGSGVHARDCKRCVLQQQLDGLVQRLDVGQSGHERAATVDFTGHFHVARDHPRADISATVDQLCLADLVNDVVAVVTACCVIDRGLKQLDVISWFVSNAALHLLRDVGIWPLALNAFTLQAHAAVDVVNLAIGAFLVAHQEQRHGDEVDRVHVVAWLHHHASGAHRQVEQELTHGNVKVRLAQDGKHLLAVQLKNGLGLWLAIHWDVKAGLQAAPAALRREHYRLQSVSKPLGAIDCCTVEDALHLLGANSTTFPNAIQLALGQGELIGVLVELLKLILLCLRQRLPLDDLFGR